MGASRTCPACGDHDSLRILSFAAKSPMGVIAFDERI
jgi:hypothetical protein